MAVNIETIQNFFFVGIAGTGMSAIAQYLSGTGKHVAGSDRYFESTEEMLIEKQFKSLGIRCYSQDGSGITNQTEVVVVSTAIESTNIEYKKAIELNIPIIKRSELLASIANNKKTIAVGGTSGKSTTTAMVFHIMNQTGFSPSLITGAGLSDLQDKGFPGNAWVGKSDWLIIEADESDGSIVGYKPEISVLLNIDRDHKEYEELMDLFTAFKHNTNTHFIVNQNDKRTKPLSQSQSIDFGYETSAGINGTDFKQHGFFITFNVDKIPFKISALGKHNMENALAAIAVCKQTGIPVKESALALKSFKGIYRRTQLIGEKNGVSVVDDFAHNPAEVAAAIGACQRIAPRVIAWFQPHGYGPLRFMHKELTQSLAATLRKDDYFVMPDVYYAGGTVSKDISSKHVIEPLSASHTNSFYSPNRDIFIQQANQWKQRGTIILIMGARDPSLGEFSKKILNSI